MKYFVAHLLLLGAILATSEGLQCWTCRGARSIQECDLNGQLMTCMPQQESCETVVARSELFQDAKYYVNKGCQAPTTCNNNQNQNTVDISYRGQASTLCNHDIGFSVCRCCCTTDRCNRGSLRCTSDYGQDCQNRTDMPHGRYVCDNGNSPGSVCDYECTEEGYSMIGHDLSVCYNNGSWSHKRPCCARPCPPYALADIVTVYHATSWNMWQHMNRLSYLSAASTAVGADSIKYAGFYYSGRPEPESVVHFNEYNDDQFQMQLLFLQRVVYNNTNDGMVNTGAALWYAYHNMFLPENGVRPHVPKMVLIVTDRNSTDDIVAPSRALREAGISVYAFAMHEEGNFMDREEFNEMVGHEEGHMYMPEESVEHVGQGMMDDFTSHFCKDPCAHVLAERQLEGNENE